MQREHQPLGDEDIHELDRKAWNLPRPRAQLATSPVPVPNGSDDAPDAASPSLRESEHLA